MGTPRLPAVQNTDIWSMNVVSLQEILLVAWIAVKDNQMKTSISAKYRMILKAEYLPSVWTTCFFFFTVSPCILIH